MGPALSTEPAPFPVFRLNAQARGREGRKNPRGFPPYYSPLPQVFPGFQSICLRESPLLRAAVLIGFFCLQIGTGLRTQCRNTAWDRTRGSPSRSRSKENPAAVGKLSKRAGSSAAAQATPSLSFPGMVQEILRSSPAVHEGRKIRLQSAGLPEIPACFCLPPPGRPQKVQKYSGSCSPLFFPPELPMILTASSVLCFRDITEDIIAPFPRQPPDRRACCPGRGPAEGGAFRRALPCLPGSSTAGRPAGSL